MMNEINETTDKLFSNITPTGFFIGLWMGITGLVLVPSDFGEMIEIAPLLLGSSWLGWVACFISGIIMLQGGLPKIKSLFVVSAIGLVGVVAILLLSSSNINSIFYIAILFFVLIAAESAIHRLILKQDEKIIWTRTNTRD
jgi:hypothetical protein